MKVKKMTKLPMKLSLLAAVAALSACSCLKSPDLNVTPNAEDSKYGKAGAAGLAAQPNSAKTKASFEEEFVKGGLNIVYFDYDKSDIRDDAAVNLKKFAEFSKTNSVKGVTVEGHADERGTREYNLALGDRRAVAVKKYLTGLGMQAGQITTISYGKERPAVEGHDEAAWGKNRRGVLVLN